MRVILRMASLRELVDITQLDIKSFIQWMKACFKMVYIMVMAKSAGRMVIFIMESFKQDKKKALEFTNLKMAMFI